MPLFYFYITVTTNMWFSPYTLPPCSARFNDRHPTFKSLTSKLKKPDVSLSIRTGHASWITPMFGTVGWLSASAIQVNTNLLATKTTKKSNSYRTLPKIALGLTHVLEFISANCSILISKLHSLSKDVEEYVRLYNRDEPLLQVSWRKADPTNKLRQSPIRHLDFLFYLVWSFSTAAEAKMAEVASRKLHPATTYNVDQLKNNLTFERLLRRGRRQLTSQISVSWRAWLLGWKNRTCYNVGIQKLSQNQDPHEKLNARSWKSTPGSQLILIPQEAV